MTKTQPPKEQTNPNRCSYSCIANNSNVKVENVGGCENSNEKLMFFGIANSRSKIKSSVSLKEID